MDDKTEAGQLEALAAWLQAHGHKAILWLVFASTLIEWINAGGDLATLTQALSLGQIGG